MKRSEWFGKKMMLLTAAALIGSCASYQHAGDIYEAFVEEFKGSSSDYFEYQSSGNSAEFTWTFGADSPTEPGTKIMSLKIDPEDEAGPPQGPHIAAKNFTHFGTYSARLKVPDAREIQPDVGAVVGYFTYHMDDEHGLSEIDFEWLIADPEVIYVGTWTGTSGDLRRVGRTINMAEGIIYETSYREGHTGPRRLLEGPQNQPESIAPIEDYDASSQFHTYGFDWYPDRIRFWMIHPETDETVVLWDYRDENLVGIPQHHSRYMINFWHTNNWPVQTNPQSIEPPVYPFEVEVDWISYNPL